MAKTQSPGEALQAELAGELELLRQENEVVARRVRRIEAMQLPVFAEVTDILKTRSILEARELLAKKTACLTDDVNIVVRGLVEQIDNVQIVLLNETKRIAAQVEEERAAAEAAAQAEAGAGK